MSNELVPKTGFALAPMDNSLLDMIREELDGLGSIPFDVVKIPSGGGVAFGAPGDDPDNPDVVKELTGVIIEHRHPDEQLLGGCVFGAGAAPDCASMDGKTGIVAATGECIDCSMCKFNQFGSDTDGRGKACKNLHRIYILREGESPAGHLQRAADVAEAIQGLSGKAAAAEGQAGESGGDAYHAQKGTERRRHRLLAGHVQQGG